MNSGLQRSAALSAGLHLAALLALIIAIPFAAPPAPPDEDSIPVEWEGTAQVAPQKGEKPAKAPAPADAETPATDNPAIKPPEKAPIETPAPPPPPPPPPPAPEDVVKPPEPTPVPPKPAEKPAPVKPPPPKPIVKPKTAPLKPVDSIRSQPNETKNAVPDTSSLFATLEKLTADQKQIQPPKHRYNPERGGAPGGGGAVHGNLTGALSDEQRKAIGAEVRRCYSEDTEARDYATYVAVITVTVDADGEAREVQLSDPDTARANADPAFRAFAERAQRAVLDPQCAKLPMPTDLLGKPSQQLTFRFRP
jgi:outer membrane biosynthesis protein TonB